MPSAVVQAAAAVAPWWGVPVVAGSFLLLGGFLTFLFTRSNDKRKETRGRQDVIASETVDLASEFITLANKFTHLGRRSMTDPLEMLTTEVVDQTSALINEHGALFTRFRLVMPSSLDMLVRKYATSTVSLVIPPFDKASMRMRLDYQAASQAEFINALRRLRGLTDLDTPNYEGAQVKVEEFADRATAEYRKHMEENGITVDEAKSQGEMS